MKQLLRIFQLATLAAVGQAYFYTVFETTTDPDKPVLLGKLRDEDVRWLSLLIRVSLDSLN